MVSGGVAGGVVSGGGGGGGGDDGGAMPARRGRCAARGAPYSTAAVASIIIVHFAVIRVAACLPHLRCMNFTDDFVVDDVFSKCVQR
jgi:hypothetical protein